MGNKGERVFVRGISSDRYELDEIRRAQLVAPKVRGEDVVVDDGSVGHSGQSKDSRSWWRLGAGDEPFLTQNIQVHFVELPPGTSNRGHGHQNEALLYILEGRGYEIHDGQRYDWEKGDLVVVHADSVHRHFNGSVDERALALVVKAKSLWMFFGLTQQGLRAPFEEQDGYGPREEWPRIWTPGADARKKIVKPSDTSWETTRDGRVRVLCSKERDDVRVFSIDLYEQEIPPSSRSAKHWHMADEIIYVLAGHGYCLQWDVKAEIQDKYYAHMGREPTRHDFKPGDLVYVPQNTVHQLFNSSPDESALVLVAHNRVIKMLGYDNVVYLEAAPEYVSGDRST